MFWIILTLIIAAISISSIINQKRRSEWKNSYFQFLSQKFGETMKDLITTSEPWIGQSDEEFLAMYGRPYHIEKVEMKTKTKLILSYPTINNSTNRPTNNKYTFENNELSKIEVKGRIHKVWEAKKQANPFTE